MLGSADLQDWADEGDLVRAEIRLLPIVARFASDRGPIQMTLGNDLSGRLRAFIKGQDLKVDALRPPSCRFDCSRCCRGHVRSAAGRTKRQNPR